jgi:hypothetical protein
MINPTLGKCSNDWGNVIMSLYKEHHLVLPGFISGMVNALPIYIPLQERGVRLYISVKKLQDLCLWICVCVRLWACVCKCMRAYVMYVCALCVYLCVRAHVCLLWVIYWLQCFMTDVFSRIFCLVILLSDHCSFHVLYKKKVFQCWTLIFLHSGCICADRAFHFVLINIMCYMYCWHFYEI